MIIHDKAFKKLIKSEDIDARIAELGKQISKDYKEQTPLFIGVLNGAFMFASDLFKNLTIEAEISFVKVSSYRDLSSTGDVKQLLGLNEPIFNRDIILLEDIVDSGNTIMKLMETLSELGPKSIEVATLLIKPAAVQHSFDVKYAGFEIPADFVVGYGLDYNGLGRNLKDIYQLKE